jgi:hypothetical protein
VFGAATYWPCQYTEIKSGHVTACRLPRPWNAEKKVKSPLLVVVCLLTNRVLISVSVPQVSSEATWLWGQLPLIVRLGATDSLDIGRELFLRRLWSTDGENLYLTP